MDEQPTAEAGWYPHGNGRRYWDGTAWTEQFAPGTSGPTAAAGGPGGVVADRGFVAPAAVHPGHGGVTAVPIQVAPKNPALALLASFFVPGLGSMVNGEVGKGVGILIGYLVSAMLSFFLIGIPGVIGFWIWGMVDGYQGAQRWNARHGILS